MSESEYRHKSHNVSILLYHFVCPAKYRKVVFDKGADETLKEVCLEIEKRYQALLIMEPYWVQEKAEMSDPRFTSTELSQYIRNCMENGGAATINMGIYQNGIVGTKALQVMREVKQSVRNGK